MEIFLFCFSFKAFLVAATVYTAAVFGLYAISLQLTNPVLYRLSTSCCGAPLDLKCRIDCPVLPFIQSDSIAFTPDAADSIIAQKDYPDQHFQKDISLKFIHKPKRNVKAVEKKSPLMMETIDNNFNLCYSSLPPLMNSNVTKKLLGGLIPFNFDLSY